MRILYITCDYPQYAGVNKKINAQIKAFHKLGIAAELKKMPPLNKFLRALPFQSSSIDWDSIPISSEIGGLYIRYQLSDKKFLAFLKRIKKENPSVKIVVEIPTYPYDKEQKIFITKWRDQYYRRYLKGLIDRIVTFSGDKRIFGIDTIKAKNGIDLEETKRRNCLSAAKKRDSLHLFCAAYFDYWHGIDRLLYGMLRYYKRGGKRRIVLHLAGQGPAVPKLKAIAGSKYLQGNVFFHGHLDTDGLDKLYNGCDLAIESLGCHRKDVPVSSTLKSREYLAKGIPIVYSGEIDVFMGKKIDFALQVPADESPIDIKTVLQFYDRLQMSYTNRELTEKIRSFAEQTVGMEHAVQPLADYFCRIETVNQYFKEMGI